MEPQLNTKQRAVSFAPEPTKSNGSDLKIAQDDNITIKTNNAYHEQGLTQANISFYYSLVGGSIGFIVLIASVFGLEEGQAYIGIISGVIIDAVSVMFFNIASNASKARTAYFDKLRDDTKHKDALTLCQSIENSKIKDNLKVKLSLYFAGLDENKICKNVIEVCSSEDNKTV